LFSATTTVSAAAGASCSAATGVFLIVCVHGFTFYDEE
jgi:hypothetical protein